MTPAGQEIRYAITDIKGLHVTGVIGASVGKRVSILIIGWYRPRTLNN